MTFALAADVAPDKSEVPVSWDVDTAYAVSRHKESNQLDHPMYPVTYVGDLAQRSVYDVMALVYAPVGFTVPPQVPCGYLAWTPYSRRISLFSEIIVLPLSGSPTVFCTSWLLPGWILSAFPVPSIQQIDIQDQDTSQVNGNNMFRLLDVLFFGKI